MKESPELSYICAYWKEKGAWSTDGCHQQHSNATHTVCTCKHLSSFAVLMALYPMEVSNICTKLNRNLMKRSSSQGHLILKHDSWSFSKNDFPLFWPRRRSKICFTSLTELLKTFTAFRLMIYVSQPVIICLEWFSLTPFTLAVERYFLKTNSPDENTLCSLPVSGLLMIIACNISN